MDFLQSLLSMDAIASLFALTILEVVLGIDNLLFLSILTNRLPEKERVIARKVGLIFAMVSRLLLLAAVNWISQLKGVLFSIFSIDVTIHSLILSLGGVFLVYKAVNEIHEDIEGDGAAKKAELSNKEIAVKGFWWVIGQVMLLDMIFSLDSIITAIGMTHNYGIMAIAIVIAVISMLIAAEPLSNFIIKHPTVKMLALSFLVLVGVMLMAEGIGYHVEKGYLYFAIAFSLLVESLNIIAKKKNLK
jgi:predicted tellurium resistance membrane protein TerC